MKKESNEIPLGSIFFNLNCLDDKSAVVGSPTSTRSSSSGNTVNSSYMRLVLHRAAKLILSATTYNLREWTDVEIKNTLDGHRENVCGTPGSYQPTRTGRAASERVDRGEARDFV